MVELIEAAARLKARGFADVAFVLAGDHQGRDGYLRELDALIATRGLNGIVRRVGHCADMPAAFLAASVVTVPSTAPEAFGRSAVEAQAMGTPGERTGWRVPPGDPEALAEAVVGALSLGASAREALSRRARAHVERHFSLERMVAATLDVYEALMASRSRPGSS